MAVTGGMWTAERDGAVQEILGLPQDLRGDPDNRHAAEEPNSDADGDIVDLVLRWASPDIPEVTADIYRGTTVADVRRIASRP